MKFFLDTEFIESGPGKPIQLISIGIRAESGEEMYAVSSEFDEATASDWVRQNVLPHLGTERRRSLKEIASRIRAFVDREIYHHPSMGQSVEFWGYYADYDWVVFCQIFGTMMDLPAGWPMYCCDIKQWCDELGNPELPKQDSTEHNALNDARWNQRAWNFLDSRRVLCETA